MRAERTMARSFQVSGSLAANELLPENRPFLIGERLNAQGSLKVKELLLAENWNALVGIAQGQADTGAHLLDLSLGVAAGSPRFRAGPFVTGGLYSVGAGLRAVLTPWRVSPTELGGLEARLTWFTPATGEVMLLYVWSEARRAPSQGRRSTHLPATGVVPGGPIVCSRLGAGLGAALSASGTGEAWEFVGSGQPIAVGGSPLVSVSCDMGGEHAGAMVSAQIAPLLRYLTGNGQAQHHLGTVSMGWMVGSPGVRFGPVATIGFWEAQAGARAVADVWVDREGLHHRVELRAGLLTSSVGAGEASLAYVVSYDPRGKPSGS